MASKAQGLLDVVARTTSRMSQQGGGASGPCSPSAYAPSSPSAFGTAMALPPPAVGTAPGWPGEQQAPGALSAQASALFTGPCQVSFNR